MSTDPTTTPHMTVVSGRPTNVLEHPQSINDLYVSCRITSGDDVYVPLTRIYDLLMDEMQRVIRMNTGKA
jgi:hypothetical protein